MARSVRCEYRSGTHLVTVSGYSGGHVFYGPQIFREFPANPRGHAPDAEIFETMLWDTCEQYDAQVLGYIIEPNSSLVVIRTVGGPLRWIMHDLLARHSKHLVALHRIPAGQRPFPRRYRAQIVQPEKLPYVIRYVQRRNSCADMRRRAINHPFSSHLIYCGRRSPPKCFVVDAFSNQLKSLGYLGPNSYFEFMSREDSPAISQMLGRHVIGEQAFAESLRARDHAWSRAASAGVPSPDEILLEVAGTLLHIDPRVTCSSTHRGALARALVAWYAMRTGAAQIGTVAEWFGVTSSGLRYLIHRHRSRSPQYFSRSTTELFPACK